MSNHKKVFGILLLISDLEALIPIVKIQKQYLGIYCNCRVSEIVYLMFRLKLSIYNIDTVKLNSYINYFAG